MNINNLQRFFMIFQLRNDKNLAQIFQF